MFAYKIVPVLSVNIVIGPFDIILNFLSKFRITKALVAIILIAIYSALLVYFTINVYNLKK